MKNAQHWIEFYDLKPHPKGCGYFKETFRAQDQVKVEGFEGSERSLSTSIISLFSGNQLTYLHKTKSHQDIHYYTGTTNLLVHIISTISKEVETTIIGPDNQIHIIVPPNTWFAFELQDKSELSYVLTGHTVTPGFDFRDFTLADRSLIGEYPSLKNFITKFTSNNNTCNNSFIRNRSKIQSNDEGSKGDFYRPTMQ